MTRLSPVLIHLVIVIAITLIAANDQYPIPVDTLITMQRGNCEGGCPVYRMVIFADGDVIWEGQARVAKTGVVLTQIQRDQVRDLIDEFRSINFLHLENIYDYRGKGCESSKPDMPIVITSFAMGGESKSIMHHDGCVGEISRKLSELENKIDTIVGTARWVSNRPAK